MTVAAVARITIGRRIQSGPSRKNGFSAAAGVSSIRAPWPK
jgi:hypothetical protein